MEYRYTSEELEKYFIQALDIFRSKMECDIDLNTVHICFFNPMNGLDMYRNFCIEYFSDKYERNHEETGFFSSIAAEAFIGKDNYGVMIREDIDFEAYDVLYTFLHELSHMYCTRNEIDGGDFYEMYCTGSGIEDGYLNAGYAIWREAIADIMADHVASEQRTACLSMSAFEVKRLYRAMLNDFPNGKKCMSLIIAYVMLSQEVSAAEDWTIAEKLIEQKISIQDKHLLQILKLVFMQMQQDKYWKISPEFIEELGTLYLCVFVDQMKG